MSSGSVRENIYDSLINDERPKVNSSLAKTDAFKMGKRLGIAPRQKIDHESNGYQAFREARGQLHGSKKIIATVPF